MAKRKAIVMKPKDNVATAVEEITPGSEVTVEVGGAQVTIQVKDKVPFGHKFAIRDIGMGEKVTKYGETIGTATADISIGQHTHVHNVGGCRGRGDLKS